MSDDLFDNIMDETPSLEDILAEFHAENDYADLAPEEPDLNTGELGSFDVTLDQIHEPVPDPEEEKQRISERLPSAAEIRAYLDSVKDKDFLNISKDIQVPQPDFEEIDQRFSVTGKAEEPSVQYNGVEVPTDPDEEYYPQVQEVELENETPAVSPHEAFSLHQQKRRKVNAKKRGSRRARILAEREKESRIKESDAVSFEEFTSYAIPTSGIDPDDYPIDSEHVSGYDSDSSVFPSTFGGYLQSVFASLFYRVHRKRVKEIHSEPVETEEELGKELKPLDASKYYGSFTQSLRLRFRIGFVLWLILLWISSGFPVFGYLKDIRVASAMCILLQFTIMMLSLDVVTNAVMNAFTVRGGVDLLAVVSCLVTSLDGLMVARGSAVSPHMPLCVISSFSLLGVLFASLVSARALRKTLRVPAIGKRIYAVTSEEAKGTRTVLKSIRPMDGFVRRTEETPFDEELFSDLAPFILAGCLLCSLLIAAVKHSFSEAIFIFAALLSSCVPFFALLSFALPFFIGSMRIFNSGAAIAGWSGTCDVGQCRDIIVTDRDIFPKGSVEIESIRIFSDADTAKVISYAGNMMAPSGMASSECFLDMMRRNGGKKYTIENIEFLPSGGIRGIIQGERVLCGNVDLMRLMNVRVPYRLVDKNSVLLAIDGILYGIFSIRYKPAKSVRNALTALMRSNRHAIFAIRDFNITPEMLHRLFDVATDGYDFPPYLDRFEISSAKASGQSRIAAVICREALGPLVDMADAGRSMYLTVKANTWITFAGILAGFLFSFTRLITAGSITPMPILILMLVFALPLPIISFLSLRRKK
jgi:hypothetical protein